MLLLSLLACGNLNKTGTTETQTETPVTCTAATPGNYARLSPDFMLGIKVFTMESDLQSVSSAQQIKDMGLNSVSISFAIPYDELGNIQYPFNPYGEQYNSAEDALCKVGNLVHEMKEAGLAVYLSGEPHYYNPLDGEEPPPLTEFEDPAVIANYTEQLLPVMKSLAEMAETYHVEYVAPISEPDKYLGDAAADALMQSLPAQFSGYQGKLVWQVYGEMFREPNTTPYRYNFRGYDSVGLAVLGCDSPRLDWDNYISAIRTWAQEDEIAEMMNVEFGCVSQPQNESEAVSNLQYWYDMTNDYSKGLIALDNPRSVPNAQSVRGTWLEDWLKSIAQSRGLIE
ncbi:MAG: hypothetical protein VX278_17530 [Myxococcota bacterium]|nr:hypothetical protein [Myxococcota bacterium]